MSPGFLESAQTPRRPARPRAHPLRAVQHRAAGGADRLAAAIVGGLAILIFAAIGLGFGAVAIILSVSEASRLPVTIGVAVFFLIAAGVAALLLRRGRNDENPTVRGHP